MNEKLLERAKYFFQKKNKENNGVCFTDKESLTDLLVEFATEETDLLSQHIIELQADKGRLTDELTEAKEIIHKVCYEFGFYDKDLMEKAKQFLKE